MIEKIVQGITRQHSTTTSRHEVVRRTWVGLGLAENQYRRRKLSREFKWALGAGREALRRRLLDGFWIMPKHSEVQAFLFRQWS